MAARKATPSHRQAGVVSTGHTSFEQQRCAASHQHAYANPALDLLPVAAGAAYLCCNAALLHTSLCRELQLPVGTQNAQNTKPHPLTCWNMPSGVRTADTCCPAPPHAEQVLGVVPGLTPLWSHVPHLRTQEATLSGRMPCYADEKLQPERMTAWWQDCRVKINRMELQGALAATTEQNTDAGIRNAGLKSEA